MQTEDVLLKFVKKLRKDITEERDALIYNISHMKVDLDEFPLEYWCGQVLAYEASLDFIDTNIRNKHSLVWISHFTRR